MPTALLETKLYVPRSPRGLVPRPRLSERLGQASASKLTLVSAPAGFGKTTLLSGWLDAAPGASGDGRLAAWLSLDPGDNEPAVFWTYVVAALRTVAPRVGESALALLQAPQPPPADVLLTGLLNDLAAIESDVVLVLDDYHVLDARDVHDGMAFLLDHLPPRLHVVIATRADPSLPLARLRARGELVEIRAADLRFTPEEAAAYLNEMMGLQLTARDVAALDARTEGWIAALQLAALSMQGRDDVAGFIAGFAGDDRYVVDYLVEEVLHRQPDRVQTFLLQTSVLDRLSGPLCDAVTGQGGGKAMLETLDRANLFLVALDDRRQWYRYHRLFADVLHARLLDEQPDRVPELHRCASVWHERNGDRSLAIRHALAAEDYDRAADLVEVAIPEMRRSRQEATLRGWLEALPGNLISTRPVLGIGLVGALMASNDFAGVEDLLQDVERRLGTTPHIRNGAAAAPGEAEVVDIEEFHRLPGAIDLYRAALALGRGDGPRTVMHARRAIELAPDDDHLVRAAAAALVGLTSWAGGDLDAAHQSYAECMAGLQRAGHISDVLGCSIALADIRITQGRLGAALRTYEQALDLVPAKDSSALRGMADMHVGISQIYVERDDLSAAMEHLTLSRELGEHMGLPQNPYRWRAGLARIREAEGNLDDALDLLGEAERLFVSDFSPHVRPVPAMKARVLAKRGRLGEALGWATQYDVTVDDELTYLHEFEHITLARVLLAEHADRPRQQAIELLERLLSRGRGREPDRQRHRDPGAAGARAADARRHLGGAGATRTRPPVGRAGGIRPHLHSTRDQPWRCCWKRRSGTRSPRTTPADCWLLSLRLRRYRP